MRSAAPPPRLTTWRATIAPWARATSSVPSREPSSTTSTAVSTPQTSAGIRSSTCADVVGLVVGGHQHADAVAKAVGVPGGAELLPGEALERAGELAREPRGLGQRADDEPEEDHDREDRDADDPGAVLALERERRQQRVGDLGAGDDRQRRAPRAAGSARRRCAARDGARSRRRRQRARRSARRRGSRSARAAGGRRAGSSSALRIGRSRTWPGLARRSGDRSCRRTRASS